MGTMPENGARGDDRDDRYAKAIAAAYNVKLIEVLTGFKYIGEQIKFFEQQHTYHYVFGLEELRAWQEPTRDKDACVAVMMLCEVASWCKKHGKTLWDAMLDMYEKYGYYREGLETKTLKGIDGAAQIQSMMSEYRTNPPKELGGHRGTGGARLQGGHQKGSCDWRVTRPDCRHPTYFIMNFLTMHGAVCARPERSLRSNSTLA